MTIKRNNLPIIAVSSAGVISILSVVFLVLLLRRRRVVVQGGQEEGDMELSVVTDNNGYYGI